MSDAEPTTQPAPGQSRNPATIVKVALAVILTAAAVVFAAQNTTSIEVDFIVWTFATRTIILMVVSAVAGVAIWEALTLIPQTAMISPGGATGPGHGP